MQVIKGVMGCEHLSTSCMLTTDYRMKLKNIQRVKRTKRTKGLKYNKYIYNINQNKG